MSRYTITYLLAILFLVSCGSKKKTLGGKISEKKKTSELVEALSLQNDKSVSFFYSKIACKYKSEEQNLSFKTSVKLHSDSLLNVMMTFAKIPVMIANVTKDSVKLINKRDKCYFFSEVDYLSNLLKMDLTLNDAEDIFLGRPIHFDQDQRFHQLNDTSYYVIATHKEKDFLNPNSKEVMMKYYLSADSLKLEKTYISSPKDSTEITIKMKETELIDNKEFPLFVEIDAIGKKGATHLELKYQRTEINQPKSIYFKIPDNYVECE